MIQGKLICVAFIDISIFYLCARPVFVPVNLEFITTMDATLHLINASPVLYQFLASISFVVRLIKCLNWGRAEDISELAYPEDAFKSRFQYLSNQD
jgi:hypothetical protein